MGLAKELGIQKGITAVIGGGGKTTLLRTLGKNWRRKSGCCSAPVQRSCRSLISLVLRVKRSCGGCGRRPICSALAARCLTPGN